MGVSVVVVSGGERGGVLPDSKCEINWIHSVMEASLKL